MNAMHITVALPSAGRTTVAGIFARFLTSDGDEVRGFAPTSRAALEMGAAGIPDAHTIHAEAAEIERWRSDHFLRPTRSCAGTRCRWRRRTSPGG
jgi:hypothetical protein